MNVSSIVVKTAAKHLQDVIDSINSVEFCEVHFYNSEGKIVATIEAESIDEQMDTLKKIQSIPFVFNASLAYTYCEDELSKVFGQIGGTDDRVPRELK